MYKRILFVCVQYETHTQDASKEYDFKIYLLIIQVEKIRFNDHQRYK